MDFVVKAYVIPFSVLIGGFALMGFIESAWFVRRFRKRED